MADVATVARRAGAVSTWLTAGERRRLEAGSVRKATAILAAHLALYAAAVLGSIAPLPLPLNLASAAVTGLAISLLFPIGHDGSHRAFTTNSFANLWIARLCFLPCLHAESLWDLGHNRTHHARTNLKGVDYSWVPMSKADYDACHPLRRALERLYRGPFGSGPYYAFTHWLPKMILPIAPEARGAWRRYLPECIAMLAVFVSLIC